MKAQFRWVALAAAIAAPSLASTQADARTRIDTIVPLNPRGTVDLSLISGTIEVSAWSRDQVQIEAFIEKGELRFEASRSRVGLRVDHENRRGRNCCKNAHYKVVVPRGARLIMQTVSGPITARGVGGETDARSISGTIDIQDSRELSFQNVSGGLRAQDISGGINGSSVSGHVTIEDVRGDIEVSSVSGPIRLAGARSRMVRANTVSGNIQYSGSVDPAGRYEFESHSGTIRLSLPADAGARLSLETFSGSFQSDFPVTLEGDSGPGRSAEAHIGRGNARIQAQTFSGSILIKRGEDRE